MGLSETGKVDIGHAVEAHPLPCPPSTACSMVGSLQVLDVGLCSGNFS